MKLRSRIILPLVAAIVPIAASSVPASAQPGLLPPGYEIEAKDLYCGPLDSPCIPFTQDTFTDVTAWNFEHVMFGRPDAVHIRCAREFLDGQGQRQAVSMNVDVAPQWLQNQFEGAFHGGTIVGFGMVQNATEQSTRAVGSIQIVAYDQTTGDTATVTGTQVTDNTNSAEGPPSEGPGFAPQALGSDRLISGGFLIVFRGPMINDNTGQLVSPNATMTCSTTHQPLPEFTFPGGADFESFFGLDTDGEGGGFS